MTLEEVAAAPGDSLIAIPAALPHVPQVRVGAEAADALRHGGGVPGPEDTPVGAVLVLDELGDVVCLAEATRQREVALQPRKVFPALCRP